MTERTRRTAAERDALRSAFEAETERYGDHLIWTGHRQNMKPVLLTSRGSEHARRLSIELATGHAPPPRVHVVATCSNWLCVAADHIQVGRKPKGDRKPRIRRKAA